MKSPKKSSLKSPKCAIKLGSNKSVPNFSELHKQWADKLEKGKAGSKKPCTITQEFGLTRSGMQFHAAAAATVGKSVTHKSASKSRLKTPKDKPYQKPHAKAKSADIEFEADQSALQSILDNTGVGLEQTNQTEGSSEGRPTDARMSYFRVPKKPGQTPKNESRTTIHATPSMRLRAKLTCQTEGANRVMSRMTMGGPAPLSARKPAKSPGMLLMSNCIEERQSLYRRVLVADPLGTPTQCGRSPASGGVLSSLRKAQRVPCDRGNSKAPRFGLTASSSRKLLPGLSKAHQDTTKECDSRPKKLSFQSDCESPSPHPTNPEVKNPVPFAGVWEEEPATTKPLADMNIDELEAEEKRLEAEVRRVQMIKRRKFKIGVDEMTSEAVKQSYSKKARSETSDAKKGKALGLMDLEAEMKKQSPLRVLSPNIRLQDQRSPRSPKLLALSSPKLSHLSPHSSKSPKRQTIRPFEGGVNAFCFDKENVSPLVSHSRSSSSPVTKKQRKSTKRGTIDQSFTESLLEIEYLESQISKVQLVSQTVSKDEMLQELEKIKRRQKKLSAHHQKLHTLQLHLQEQQVSRESVKVNEKKTVDAMTSPVAIPAASGHDSDWMFSSGSDSDKENEDPHASGRKPTGATAGCPSHRDISSRILQEIPQPKLSPGEASPDCLTVSVSSQEEDQQESSSPLPVPVFYSPAHKGLGRNQRAVATGPQLLSPMRGSAQLLGAFSSEHQTPVFSTLLTSPAPKGCLSPLAAKLLESSEEGGDSTIDSPPLIPLTENWISLSSAHQDTENTRLKKTPMSPLMRQACYIQQSPQRTRSPGDLSLLGNLQPLASPFRRGTASPRGLLQSQYHEKYHDCLLDQEVALFSGQAGLRLGSGFSPVLERCRDPVSSMLHDADARHFQPIECFTKALSPLAGTAYSVLCGTQSV